MNEREKNDEEAEETAAGKETEEISKEDVEIRRLIEERRNTPKEEQQRLREVSKHILKCIRDKQRMKRQQDIQRILENFADVFGEFYKKYMTTKNKKKLNKKSVRMKMRAASMCTAETPMR